METLREFILGKISKLQEDLFPMDGDEFGTNGKIKVAASPLRPAEVKKMIAVGKGLRILVGAGILRDWMAVWVGDSDSNVGAMHDTIASQFGLAMNARHVPLEMTRSGKLRLTTTAQGMFDSKREVEDVLDRNKEFQSIFGGQRVDMSKLHEDVATHK